jgi:hypothetical protein
MENRRTNELSILGAMTMLFGAGIYLLDDSAANSWHLFRAPGIVLLIAGSLLGFIGRVTERAA